MAEQFGGGLRAEQFGRRCQILERIEAGAFLPKRGTDEVFVAATQYAGNLQQVVSISSSNRIGR